MAGMEIFGWLTFLLTMIFLVRVELSPLPAPAAAPAESVAIAPTAVPSDVLRWRDIEPFLPWKTCLGLLAITAIGLAVNGTAKIDWVYDLGSQRWMFLLLSNSLALAYCFPTFKGYRVFLPFVTLVALYAIVQTFTGLDLLRPGEHRAVQPLDLTASHPLWRSAGLFGSPLEYGYIAGQHVCLPLAIVLLGFSERWQKRRSQNQNLAPDFELSQTLFAASMLAVALIGLSVVTTFTRGAWIAMVVSWAVMIFIAERRVALWFAAAGTTVFAALYASVEIFRLRVLSLFDTHYASNSERMFLWKANFAMFRDYPIFGIGYQENEARAGEYVARLGNPHAFTGHAHNNYIQMLSGTGVTGFAAYIVLISFMLWLSWRLWQRIPRENFWHRALALAALGAQIDLHVGGFTECNFKAGVTSHNTMVAWAIVIALSAYYRNQERHVPAPSLA